MAVLSEKSLGDILYQEVDSLPTHVAPKGTVAISTSPPLVFKNLDGNVNWMIMVMPVYGDIYYEYHMIHCK